MHHDSSCAGLTRKVAEDQGQRDRRADHSHTLMRPRRTADIQLIAALDFHNRTDGKSFDSAQDSVFLS